MRAAIDIRVRGRIVAIPVTRPAIAPVVPIAADIRRVVRVKSPLWGLFAPKPPF